MVMSAVSEVRTAVMGPPSLLTKEPVRPPGRRLDEDARRDLLVDVLVERLTKERQEYELDSWFTTLVPPEDARHRQEVFRDLADARLRAGVTSFCEANRRVRRILAMTDKLSYDLARRGWFLTAARSYTSNLQALAGVLRDAQPSSNALQGVGRWLEEHIASASFHSLANEAADLGARLGEVRYRLRLRGLSVTVQAVDPDEPEYAAEVLDTFERFRQGEGGSHLKKIGEPGSMDHVEAAIAGFVARLNPELFTAMGSFRERRRDLVLPEVVGLEREAQFFLAVLDLIDETSSQGVMWTLPTITDDNAVEVEGAHDLSLVIGRRRTPLVPNDCTMTSAERLAVVTGPNQGGKTTYARMLGQLHLLTAIGAPVPAAAARLPVVDRILTIFERGENLTDLRGHLQDDLTRARALVDEVTPQSLVILNEVYASTTPDDAVFLARDLLTRLERSAGRVVCVTFLDELSRLTAHTVSLVAGIDQAEQTRRTYRVERRPADGLAYVHALAQQHRLTGSDLRRRLQP
jgi:hypothetical protein